MEHATFELGHRDRAIKDQLLVAEETGYCACGACSIAQGSSRDLSGLRSQP